MNSLKNSVTTPAKRNHRRLLIILFYGLTVLGGILSTTRFDPGFWGGFLLAGVFTILLILSTAGIIVLPSRKLDERQQHLQNVTFRSAYRTLMGLALVAVPFVLNPNWLAGVPVAGLLSLVIAVVVLLPVTIVAWTRPYQRNLFRTPRETCLMTWFDGLEPDPIREDILPENTRKLA